MEEQIPCLNEPVLFCKKIMYKLERALCRLNFALLSLPSEWCLKRMKKYTRSPEVLRAKLKLGRIERGCDVQRPNSGDNTFNQRFFVTQIFCCLDEM